VGANFFTGHNLVRWYTSESVMDGQCDARHKVTIPATQHQCYLTGTRLHPLVMWARVSN